MPLIKLKDVEVQCPECGATYHKPERVDIDDPPETIEGKCYAPHPARNAGFEGCGETVDLEVINVEHID